MNDPSDRRHVAVEDAVQQGLAAGLAASGNDLAVKIGYDQVAFIAVNEGNAARLDDHQILSRNPGAEVAAVSGLDASTVGPRGGLDEILLDIRQAVRPRALAGIHCQISIAFCNSGHCLAASSRATPLAAASTARSMALAPAAAP